MDFTLYCLRLFLFVCSVFPDKFHVRLSYDRIMDLRNDICMYVCISFLTVYSKVFKRTVDIGFNPLMPELNIFRQN